MWNSLIPRPRSLPRSFFRELSELNRDLDRLSEGVFDPRQPQSARAWWPAAEEEVKDGTLVLRYDLPGIDPKDVQVSLDGRTLTVTGERKAERETGKGAHRASEVRYGRFERSITVPEGLDPEKVTARYTNGVLEVTVPLPAAFTGRRIPVQITTPEPPPPTA